jgi:hypothetical protein
MVAWDLDPITPFAAVRRAQSILPESKLTVYRGEGRAIALIHGEEILRALA